MIVYFFKKKTSVDAHETESVCNKSDQTSISRPRGTAASRSTLPIHFKHEESWKQLGWRTWKSIYLSQNRPDVQIVDADLIFQRKGVVFSVWTTFFWCPSAYYFPLLCFDVECPMKRRKKTMRVVKAKRDAGMDRDSKSWTHARPDVQYFDAHIITVVCHVYNSSWPWADILMYVIGVPQWEFAPIEYRKPKVSNSNIRLFSSSKQGLCSFQWVQPFMWLAAKTVMGRLELQRQNTSKGSSKNEFMKKRIFTIQTRNSSTCGFECITQTKFPLPPCVLDLHFQQNFCDSWKCVPKSKVHQTYMLENVLFLHGLVPKCLSAQGTP